MRYNILFAQIFLFIFCSVGHSATIKNTDTKVQNIIIAEGAERRNVALQAGQQLDICVQGCFITVASGDEYALTGSEIIEIVNDIVNFR